MIYNYKGIRDCDSRCEIEVKGNVVKVTEMVDNPGTSITNWAEHLANKVCEEFGIDKENLVWLECYDEPPQEYAIVEFELDNGELVNPKWKHCSKETIVTMFR